MLASSLAAGLSFWRASELRLPPAHPLESSPQAGAPARLFALSLPDAEGRMHPLAQWKDRVLVVNFWATWCPPCKEEMPDFSRISSKFSKNGVQFAGISIDSPDKVRAFASAVPVSYPLLVADLDTLALSADLGNQARALPFTVVFRAGGAVQRVKLGRFPPEQLERAILEALAPA